MYVDNGGLTAPYDMMSHLCRAAIMAMIAICGSPDEQLQQCTLP
jgi:hypothetical protein